MLTDSTHQRLFDHGFYGEDALDNWCPFAECCGASLPELIEACEGHKRKFFLGHMNGKQHGWHVQSRGVLTKSCPSPEEAVAELWLTLNPKKSQVK